MLTRDSSTGEAKGYTNGILQWTYTGGTGAVVVPPNNVLIFFEDDFPTGANEAQAGSVDCIAVYDGVLTAADVADLAAGEFCEVSDTTAPEISVPDDFTVQANSLAGAQVDYVANASDDVGVVSFICDPASGDQFNIGDTLVTCDASDAATNSSQATFTVTVELLSVSVEIQSGKLNLGKNGVLPVVIPGSTDLDVITISVSGLDLNGAGTAHGGHIDDIDGDGFDDLVVHFPVPDLDIDPLPVDGDVVTLTLTGELDDGTPFEGADDVAVKVQNEKPTSNPSKGGGRGK